MRSGNDFVFGTLKDRISYDDSRWEADKAQIAAEFDDEDEFV